MQLDSPKFELIWRDPARRRRVIAFLIVVAVEALIILALLTLGNSPLPPRTLQSDLVAFSLSMPKAESEKRKSSPAPAKQKPAAPEAAKKTPEILPPQPKPTPNMVPMSKKDFAASDIGTLGKAAGSAGAKTAYGPGDGPGGQTLYPAEWYREPGPNVLADSLPTGAPEGAWAMIACRTIERYHVENCVGMGESHVGLSLALRKAAWQFQVLPPRVNGRPLIGAWVRIRFDFTKKTGE
jgi:hypothetical protein